MDTFSPPCTFSVHRILVDFILHKTKYIFNINFMSESIYFHTSAPSKTTPARTITKKPIPSEKGAAKVLLEGVEKLFRN